MSDCAHTFILQHRGASKRIAQAIYKKMSLFKAD